MSIYGYFDVLTDSQGGLCRNNRITIMEDDLETYKIVIIGSSGTGKTNISTRYTRDTFNAIGQATLGVEFMNKVVELPSHKKVKISLWDTAGQQRYKALSKVYYKGASGAIVVYDITDPNSYIEVESWMKLLNENVNIEDVVLAVVGNKLDLEANREVPSERPVQEFKEAFDIECWEVSAKTGHNIEALFQDMVQKIVERANDVKSTMYRGTVEYAESERGTLVGGSKEMNTLNANNNYGPRNGSIIIEEEEDGVSVAAEVRGLHSTNEVPMRMTLTPEQHKKHQQMNELKKQKKCCLQG